MTKVTELIKSKRQLTYSFEVTPGVTEEEIDKIQIDPLFYSVTWHAKSHRCKDLNIDPLRTASLLVEKQKHVLLHMSCDMLRVEYLKQILDTLQEKNICNLFLVLGESYDPKTSDFTNTSQLIKFIREQTGDYFCIGIAGFPGCTDEKLLHTKEKVESGADFIITQAFFDINTFTTFSERCRKFDISVPIIPGVFPFESYKQLTGFVNLCKIKVSSDLLDSVKNNEDLNKPCLDVVRSLIEELYKEHHTTHFHFYTLNKLERVNTFIQTLLGSDKNI
ncbi:methylenetetrahydrofolate reductase (NADPH) [Anticarsia gemmatalis]|uniref:methylenetetrahydrofolate reductase (NADPH) n=1 Tax=Anticarsia gemmatalis TaxID=129554 RepID=UPI003F76938E